MWVGSDKILVAICSVLDLYNCSRLVSGVQHIAILQEMVYILFSFSWFLTGVVNTIVCVSKQHRLVRLRPVNCQLTGGLQLLVLLPDTAELQHAEDTGGRTGKIRFIFPFWVQCNVSEQ